ncbi:MAG TPA: DUF3558 family protein [Pseudonocardia sp.]|jgi:hypothetical protein|nr:DUF3558 family protein [Pseudonocardia sp.]
MAIRRAALRGLLLAVAVLVTGCGGPDSGRPVPTVTLDPLDVTPYASRPCDLLRDDRAGRRHLATPGTLTSSADGPVCRWTPTQPRVPVYTAGVVLGKGLPDVTGRGGDYSFLDRSEIAHYPALHTRDRASGSNARCTTRVGVADDSQVTVTADDNGEAVRSSLDACSEADILATEILGQLLAATG